MAQNKQIHLDNRPTGEAVASNFKLVVAETPALQDGQVLVRHHFLSLDPYMRGRMNDAKSYAQPQPLGQTMQGGTVGEVVESRSTKFAVGDKVVGMGGWQQYQVADAAAQARDLIAPLHAAEAQVNAVVLGKAHEVRLALVCLLAGGHLLLEDLPGVGKTTLAQALAATFDLQIGRAHV